MTARHRAREYALQILYRFDADLATDNLTERAAELREHMTHFSIPEDLREFVSQLVLGVAHHLAEIDQSIEKRSQNWRLSRMSAVDRALLRLSSYELLKHPEVPTQVVIHEAVELAKQFGAQETPAFINGVLDAVAQQLPK